jgi:hypothetical protein
MSDAPERAKPMRADDLAEWRKANPRSSLGLVAFSAWVNLPPEKLPSECMYHGCPATKEAWDRVSDAMQAALRADREAVAERAIEAAAEWHDRRAKEHTALSDEYRAGATPWFAHIRMAKDHHDNAAAIRAIRHDSEAWRRIVEGSPEAAAAQVEVWKDG